MASNSFGQAFRISTFVTVFSFLSLASSALSDDAKIRVLFIGNSLSAVNNLPQLIADLAKSRQHSMEYDVYASGGYQFSQHAADQKLLNKINEGTWDYVVLQEQGQLPAFSESQVSQEVYPYARELSGLIRKASPKAHIVFYMTMAREHGDPYNAPKISSELETYEGMQGRINQSYLNMARENNALVAPVGQVWKKVREQYPSVGLYANENHPNLTGSYLAACVFFNVLFSDTSAGLPYPSMIDGKTASDIQHTTDEIVRLPGWNWEARREKLAKLDTSEMPDQKTAGASAENFKKFIGTWITLNTKKEFLIIKPKDDFIEMKHPESHSKWRFEIRNIRVEGDKLRFERISYTKDGSQDPYNGEVSYGEIREISDGKMHLRLSETDDMTKAADITLINSQNKDSKNNSASSQDFNIMEVMLFLNANFLPEGAADYKADYDNKKVQYFDKDRRLFMENYLDAHNDIVMKKYNANGDIISETKITEDDFKEGSSRVHMAHEEKDVPRIKSILQNLSEAAENYAKANNGQYPAKMPDLTPYLSTCMCDQTVEMYRIRCDVGTNGYEFIAQSIWSHYESYVILTGGKLEVKKTGELGRAIPFQASKSPCGSK